MKYINPFSHIQGEKMSVSSKQLKLPKHHRLRLHTTYYNNSFLLRTEIVVNGQRTQVDINEKGWLTLNCRHPKAAVTFDSLIRQVDSTFQQHLIHGVSQYWCEEMPLFQLKVSGPDDLRKLFALEEQIQDDIALKFNDSITTQLQSSNPETPPPRLRVLVKMEVFFLIPDNVKKDGKLIRVDKDNIVHCVDLLKESAIFEFDAVYRAYRINPTHEDKGSYFIVVCHIESPACSPISTHYSALIIIIRNFVIVITITCINGSNY